MSIHTLHLEAVMLLFLCTVLTVGNSLLYRGMRGIHWFSLFNFVSFLSAVAIALRGTIPDAASIVTGDLLFVCAFLFFFLSLSTLFGGDRKHFWFQGALVAIACVALLQWGVLNPNTTLRLIAYSGVLCLQEIHIAVFLYRREDRVARRVGGPLSVMLGLLALANMVRIAGLLMQGAPSEYLQASGFLALIVMINSCLQCGIVVGYVWMTSGILRNDLQTQASTDPLTGLLNRRALESAAEKQIVNCANTGKPISAVLIDLDSFKAINDTSGHHRGDETLIAIGRLLLAKTRRYDLLARMGGDEFAIIMPFTPLPEAAAVANRLRLAIRSLKIGDENPTNVTCSLGVAQAAMGTLSWERLSLVCDRALYDAKHGGGDSARTAFDLDEDSKPQAFPVSSGAAPDRSYNPLKA